MSPCARKMHTQSTEETQGSRDNPAFPARWFDGLCRALLGDEFPLVTVASRIDDAVRPVGLAAPPRKLGCSNDSRDHTVWPYASSAVRTTRLAKSSRGSAQSTAPPCPSHPRRRCLRPPQSQPTTVTTYDRPFPWAGVIRVMTQIRIRVKRIFGRTGNCCARLSGRSPSTATAVDLFLRRRLCAEWR
jgi:hypothetical protein